MLIILSLNLGSLFLCTQNRPGEYDANLLLVEQLEVAVSFAVERLFVHYEIYEFLALFVQTLQMVGTPLQDSQKLPILSQVVEQFDACVIPSYRSKIVEHNLQEAADYIRETVFHHFHLYQFLLSQEQPINLETLCLPIDVVPSNLVPLAEGIEEEEWLKREKVKKLEEENALKEKELLDSHTKVQTELENKLKEVYKTELAKIDEGESKSMTPDEVTGVIESLVTAHMELMTSSVTHALQKQEMALNSRLHKMEILSTTSDKQYLSTSPNTGPTSPMGKKPSSRLSVSMSNSKQ